MPQIHTINIMVTSCYKQGRNFDTFSGGGGGGGAEVFSDLFISSNSSSKNGPGSSKLPCRSIL